MKVAIITRTRNRPLLLKRTLLSVKNQTYKDYIQIIINSIGGDLEQVKNLCKLINPDKTIVVNSSYHDFDIGFMMNLGIQYAKENNCTHISTLDDDDVWAIEYLEKMMDTILKTNSMGVVCKSILITEKILDNKIKIVNKRIMEKDNNILLDKLEFNYRFPCQFLYDLDSLKVVGEYPLGIQWGDDYFWKKFKKYYQIAICSEYLYRRHVRINDKVDYYTNIDTLLDTKKEKKKINSLIQGEKDIDLIAHMIEQYDKGDKNGLRQ